MDFADFVSLSLRSLPRPFASFRSLNARMNGKGSDMLRFGLLLSLFGNLCYSVSISLMEMRTADAVFSSPWIAFLAIAVNYLLDFFLFSWASFYLNLKGKSHDSRKSLGLFFFSEFPLFVCLPLALLFLVLPSGFFELLRIFVFAVPFAILIFKVYILSLIGKISFVKSAFILASPLLALLLLIVMFAFMAFASLPVSMVTGG